MLTEIVDTLVLKAHTIEHALGCLCHTGIIVTFTGMQRCTLDNDATQAIKGDEISKLQPVAKGARGCHYGILQG